MKKYTVIFAGFIAVLYTGDWVLAEESTLIKQPDKPVMRTAEKSEQAVDKSMSEEAIEAWFNDESEEKALAVNEGDLKLLGQVPDEPVHHIHNQFTITKNSLTSGWVEFIQCHEHLDAVPATQVVYRYQRMKNLRIDSYSGIAKAWVEGKSIQLEDISKGASICVRAVADILRPLANDGYVLRNGPFHRKFLDGYYPMQVTLDIYFPGEAIQFDSIEPEKQPGFEVQSKTGRLYVNAWFEGKLMTEITFKQLMKRSH